MRADARKYYRHLLSVAQSGDKLQKSDIAIIQKIHSDIEANDEEKSHGIADCMPPRLSDMMMATIRTAP